MSSAAKMKRAKAKRDEAEPVQPAPVGLRLPTRALPYALALFLGSTLLFLLEPFAAKRLCPLLV